MSTLPVIDRITSRLLVPPDGRRTGHKPRNFRRQPLGSLPFAKEFDLPEIPRSEWADRIREKEKQKSGLVPLLDAIGLPVKDQGSTNYCWINAPVHCLEIIRAVQGQPYVELSPASVGAKIKNFRNVGGWGTEGLEYLVRHGAVPASVWPCNAINRKYDTAAADKHRQRFQVDEWYDLEPRNIGQLATCVLLDLPVAIGLNWWGHEVTAIGMTYRSGRFFWVINNNWGRRWGDNGRAELTEAKARPDDAVAPRAVTATS